MSDNSYQSTFDFPSKILPGFSFVVKKMSHGRRISLNKEAASVNSDLREVRNQLSVIEDRIEKATAANNLLPCTCPKPVSIEGKPPVEHKHSDSGNCLECDCRGLPDELLNDINESYRVRMDEMWGGVITARLFPILIRCMVEKFAGGIDGVDNLTHDQFLDKAPDELVVEVGTMIDKMTRMSMSEIESFVSLGTSSTQVAEQTTSTSA